MVFVFLFTVIGKVPFRRKRRERHFLSVRIHNVWGQAAILLHLLVYLAQTAVPIEKFVDSHTEDLPEEKLALSTEEKTHKKKQREQACVTSRGWAHLDIKREQDVSFRLFWRRNP